MNDLHCMASSSTGGVRRAIAVLADADFLASPGFRRVANKGEATVLALSGCKIGAAFLALRFLSDACASSMRSREAFG